MIKKKAYPTMDLRNLLCCLSVLWCAALSAAPMPQSFDLSDLDGSTGFTINGEAVNDKAGFALGGNFDINNDGISDVVIGAYGGDPAGRNRAGKVYVLFGSSGIGSSGSEDLASLNGSNGFELTGINADDFAGWSVIGAGDLNDDGIDDLLIGAPDSDQGANIAAGETYVVFGRSNIGSSGTLNLSSLNGNNGFVLNGVTITDRSGRTVAGRGDLNNDGINDIAIGAPGASPNGRSLAGITYVVFGSSSLGSSGSVELSALNGNNGMRIIGAAPDDKSGQSVSFAGDIDNDGIDDLIIGAPGVDIGDSRDSGAAYIIFGRNNVGGNGEADLGTLSGGDGFILSGAKILDGAGVSVSGSGDVNGDGIADVLIGADRADPRSSNPEGDNLAGETYVVFGSTGIGSGGSFSLSNLNGSNGYVIEGIAVKDGSGVAVAGAGDINGDGVDDIAIGAHGANPNGFVDAGITYVILGGSNVGSSGSFLLSNLDGSNGFALNGITASDLSGGAIAGAGDVNADGIDDLVIAASNADPGGNVRAGESYVVFMPLPDTAEPNNTAAQALNFPAGETQSHSLSPAGDVDRFSFTLNQSSDIIITTANDGTEIDYDTRLTLFDDTGSVIRANNNFGGTVYSQISIFLPAGNYVFRVHSAVPGLVIPSYLINLIVQGSSAQMCQGLLVTVNIGNNDDPTDEDDVILGTAGNDTIAAGDGNDVICGEAGNDTIYGGPGTDLIEGGDGDDIIRGGSGRDTISGGSGQDFLIGNTAQDTLFGGEGNDILNGGSGNDSLYGDAGNDEIFGVSGDDLIEGNAGVDAIDGGAGNDTIFTGAGATVGTGVFATGAEGDDILNGGPDADDLRGDGGTDIINGADGNDFIRGGSGRDTISGGKGNDRLYGNTARDRLFGGEGDDIVNGGSGSDSLSGDAGNDQIVGGTGNDTLNGDDGNDSLSGGSGIDTCNGQEGVDVSDASCESTTSVP